MRLQMLVLVALLASGPGAVHAAGLPDTGQGNCYDGGTTLVACTSLNTGDAATYPRQDGRFGRDAKAAAGTLARIGGGAAGFDYTKLGADGNPLAIQGANWSVDASGFDNGIEAAGTHWSCVKDNITELTWEVKRNTEFSLFLPFDFEGWISQYATLYAWYSTDVLTNGGDAGSMSLYCGPTPSSYSLGCFTQQYVAVVNGRAQCGYRDWRVPSQRELLTLVHRGARNPSIDSTYFPNTVASTYWSSSSYAPDPTAAWVVDFSDGSVSAVAKPTRIRLRLVRGVRF